MLRIVIEGDELYDEETETFQSTGDVVVELEHSLISLSKWESEFQKPFLSSGEKTPEEIFGYLKTMVITPGMDPDVLVHCTKEQIDMIQGYIDSSQSATTFGKMPERRGPGEVITSELIYYWMVAFTIPWEAQFWHLNRLFALIRICNIKNSKSNQSQRPTRDDLEERRRVNEERKRLLGTTG